MFPEKEKTYPGRQFIQLLQTALVIGIGVFSFMALTRPQDTTPVATPVSAVDEDVRPFIEDVPPVIEDVPAVIEAEPTDAPDQIALALYRKAWIEQDEGNLAESIELYTQVLELDPTMASAWLGRAVAYAKIGENERSSRNDFWRYVQTMETERIERDIKPNESVTLMLDSAEGRVYGFTFKAKSGDVLDVTAKTVVRGEPDEEGVTDPLILVFDAEGTLLLADDDTLRSDGSLINMNSRIDDYMILEDGTYKLLVTHAGGGSEGIIELKFSIR